MAQNPLMEELQSLQAELAREEARLTELNNYRTQIGTTAANYPGSPIIAAADRACSDQQAVVNRLRALVDAKIKAVAALDAAAAQAVSEGLTPEAGYEKALADQDRAKAVKYIGIAVAIIIVLAAIYWFILRRK